jgi:hypothetical protein
MSKSRNDCVSNFRGAILQGSRRALVLAAGLMAAGTIGTQAAVLLYSHGDPTPAEQYMLELVNRARANPAAEAGRYGIDLNEGVPSDETISTTPKQPLAFNPNITQAARGHSQWMLDNDTFSHYELVLDPGARMLATGYVFAGSWTWGENIAWRGSFPSSPPLVPTVATEHQDLFVDSGVAGRGHRVNLMTDGFREIGIGVKEGVFTVSSQNYNAVMVTQDFGSSGANPGPFLLGVVYHDSDGNKFYTAGEGLAGVKVTVPNGAFYANTSTSGGYAVPVTGLSGTIQVTISGGPLATPITKAITLTGKNVKLDFETGADVPVVFGFVRGSMHRSKAGQFDADLYGPAGITLSIEASADFKGWSKVGTVTLTASGGHFTDVQATPTRRFYRAVKN